MSDKDKEYIPYLTDEELYYLIEDTEKNMMVAAPPDMTGELLDKIEAFEKKRESDRQQKVIEYRHFCIRVSVAVAAAIAIICVAPMVSSGLRSPLSNQFVSMKTDAGTQIPSREDVLAKEKIPQREEVVKNDIPTREAILSKNGITDSIRDSHLISDAYSRNNDR